MHLLRYVYRLKKFSVTPGMSTMMGCGVPKFVSSRVAVLTAISSGILFLTAVVVLPSTSVAGILIASDSGALRSDPGVSAAVLRIFG